MYILSIHAGHGATVGLLKDGKVMACASEERFNRKKNFMGWPQQALNWVLEFGGISVADLDLVVIVGRDARSHSMYLFNTGPFLEGNKPTKERTVMSRLTDTAKRRFINNRLLWEKFVQLQEVKYNTTQRKSLEERMHAEYAKKLGISKNKIIFIDHHYAHATSTAFNLPTDRNTLVFTLDGEGDDSCATVNVFDGRTMRRISSTRKDRSIGWLYFHVTKFLGMKGNEHEFKVMGLAPYAKSEHADKVFEKLRKVIFLDPKSKLQFNTTLPIPLMDVWLEDHMRGVRFDNLAAGAQKLTEELILEWVREGIRSTGIRDVALSGGVFMNVKANMRVAQMPEVKSLFVMPSSGDESLPFGALWHGYKLLSEERNTPFTPVPITDLYLGKEWTNEEIKAYLQSAGITKRYKVRYLPHIEEEVAALLANGEVVARMNGRAEWGARALGNRSILANPSNFNTVKLINEMIKNRDFWMPFTPSMLDTDEQRYVVNLKRIPATYMCITFESTKLGQQHLPAAMHPYDHTIRPQVVYETWNPSYHKIIKAFKKRTGIGAVLNTSFNLHGEPNVNSPEDAIHTMDESGLRNLALGNFLIQKGEK